MKLLTVFLTLLFYFSFAGRVSSQWVMTNAPNQSGIALANLGTRIFAGTQIDGLYYSTDKGENWIKGYCELSETVLASVFAISESKIFSAGLHIYRSIDSGVTWERMDTGTTTYNIGSMAILDTYLFIGTQYGVYRSTDEGKSWVQMNNGLPDTYVTALAVLGTNLFAGTDKDMIYRSTDNGVTWEKSSDGFNGREVNTFLVSGTDVLVGTNGYILSPHGSVYRSSNNGKNWEESNTGLEAERVLSFAKSGNNLFAGTQSSNVYSSTDNGFTWSKSGYLYGGIPALVISDSILFARSYNNVWRRPLSEFTTEVKEDNVQISFSLEQNIPNPASSTTNISFHISSHEFVKLKVLDILGREVRVLASETLSPGSYSYSWDASNHAAGEYFYQLQVGGRSDVKKLVLIK